MDVKKGDERRLYERVVRDSDSLGMLLQICPVLAERFRKIKASWGFEDDRSVVAVLINREWEKIK